MTKIKVKVPDTQVEYEGGGKVSPEPSNSAFRGGKKVTQRRSETELIHCPGRVGARAA